MLACFSPVIKYFVAVFFKFCFLSATVFKTMEGNFCSFLMKRFQFIVNINHASIIRREWDIKSNDMKVFRAHVLKDKPEINYFIKGNKNTNNALPLPPLKEDKQPKTPNKNALLKSARHLHLSLP